RAADVRTVHRDPDTIAELIRDSYRRGQLQVRLGRVAGPSSRLHAAHRAGFNVVWSLPNVLRAERGERARLLRAWPLVLPAGAVSNSWSARRRKSVARRLRFQ